MNWGNVLPPVIKKMDEVFSMQAVSFIHSWYYLHCKYSEYQCSRDLVLDFCLSPFFFSQPFPLLLWLHLLRLSSFIFCMYASDTVCNDLPLFFLCLSLLTGSGQELWLVTYSCIETLPTVRYCKRNWLELCEPNWLHRTAGLSGKMSQCRSTDGISI